jgi:hypothetical protein
VNLAELTEVFKMLGAPDPEAWAASQIEEGVPQLHRYVFLKQAWSAVIEPDNTHWIENLQRGTGSTSEALGRLVESGCSENDLNQVVRAMQTELLFSVCNLLECPDPETVGSLDIRWNLFACDKFDVPGECIPSLHESVLGTDPCAHGDRQ